MVCYYIWFDMLINVVSGSNRHLFEFCLVCCSLIPSFSLSGYLDHATVKEWRVVHIYISTVFICIIYLFIYGQFDKRQKKRPILVKIRTLWTGRQFMTGLKYRDNVCKLLKTRTLHCITSSRGLSGVIWVNKGLWVQWNRPNNNNNNNKYFCNKTL